MQTAIIRYGKGKSVRVRVDTRYLGTPSGSTEREEVVWRGYTMDGYWDGDARHDTIVYADDVPADAIPLLESIWTARYYRRELSRINDPDDSYGLDYGPDDLDPPTPEQVDLLRSAGYDQYGRDRARKSHKNKGVR